MKDERKRILADIVARDDVYYSASAGFDNMHIHARSTADDGVQEAHLKMRWRGCWPILKRI